MQLAAFRVHAGARALAGCAEWARAGNRPIPGPHQAAVFKVGEASSCRRRSRRFLNRLTVQETAGKDLLSILARRARLRSELDDADRDRGSD